MKFVILGIGKTKQAYIEAGCKEYIKRIERYYAIETNFISIPRRKSSKPAEEIKSEEADLISRWIKPDDFVILLDEKGKEYTSVAFSKFLEEKMNFGPKRLVFVIGGAFGHHSGLKTRSDALLSLSKMTLSHQLIRLVFLEQLYRAVTIIHNHPYHNN
jgi:23S rRNA (pseudouridine1915-N3)-methyltransferase